MANLQNIANSLLKTTQGNTQSIKQAQLYLQRMSRQGNFMEILLAIPQMDGVSTNLAKIATVYTLTYTRNLVLWKNQTLINTTVQKMITFLSTPTIPFSYKDQIGAALQYLIQKDYNNIIVSAFLPNMIDTLKKCIQSANNQINYEFIVLVSEALADKVVPATAGYVEQYTRQSVVGLSCLGVKIVELGAQFIGNDNGYLEKALLLLTKILKTLKKYLRKFHFFSVAISTCLEHPHFLSLIKSVLTLNFPQNSQKLPIFYIATSQCILSPKVLQHFHIIKSLIIYIIAQTLRIAINQQNSGNMKGNSVLCTKVGEMCQQFIAVFVQAVENLLNKMPYYKIKSQAVFKVIQEIYGFLGVSLRSCRFYSLLHSQKQSLIYSCILKCLALTPTDIQNYYHNPPQFLHSLLHIIQLDSNLLGLNPNQPTHQDQQISLLIFDTLKTHSANLLKIYCKYIDGTLAQLMFFIHNVIEQKINIQISKNLMFLILAILRDQVKNREDLVKEVEMIVFRELAELEPPTKKVQQPYNIQYAMNLLVLNRYLLIFDKLHQNSPESPIQHSFLLTQSLLKTPTLEQTPRLLASQLLYTILSTSQGSLYSRRTLQILTETLSIKSINGRYIQCIQQIIKENGNIFSNDCLVLVAVIEKVVAMLLAVLKGSNVGEGTDRDKMGEVGQKLWHVLEAVVQSRDIVGHMAQTMRRVMQPLLEMIDGQNEIQLQEKVYKLMLGIIKNTAQVGQFEIQILGVLPKTFYVGNKKRSLSTSFAVLQYILMFGKTQFTDQSLLKNLLFLTLQSITSKTTQQLQGILTLQSIIIQLSQILTKQMWLTITKSIVQLVKDQKFIYSFIKAQYVTLLMLILSQGGISLFQENDCQQILKIVWSNYEGVAGIHAGRLFVIGCCNLMGKIGAAGGYLRNCLVHIFDICITILKVSINQTDTDEMDTQLKQYNKVVQSSMNKYIKLDQYQYFKNTVWQLKQKYAEVYQILYQQLPNAKKEYLNQITRVKRVGDHARVIYRLKGKVQTRM